MRDFRCYAGLAAVEFAADSKKNTTIIQGEFGKTTMVNALQFALYGHAAVSGEATSLLINDQAIHLSGEQDPGRAFVTLDFTHDRQRYQLTRSIRGYLVAGEIRYLPVQGDDLRLTCTDPSGAAKDDPSPDQSIERMLPFAIRNFVLVDARGMVHTTPSALDSLKREVESEKPAVDERFRTRLGVEATGVLRQLMPTSKQSFFSAVKIDQNFRFYVINESDTDVRPYLAMGESYIVSLAFLLAINRLRGWEAPLVIDEPFAFLDAPSKAALGRWLPTFTPQLVLLGTVNSLRFGAEELEPRIGQRIRLIPDDPRDGANVRVVSNREDDA